MAFLEVVFLRAGLSVIELAALSQLTSRPSFEISDLFHNNIMYIPLVISYIPV